MNQMKGKNPDGVFMSGYFTQVGPIAQAARDAGMTSAKFLGGDGWDSPTLLDKGGKAIIGGFMCNHYNNKENRPEVKEFLKKWGAANGGKEPGTTMAALGYDAAAVGLQAIKDSKSPDSAGIIAALENIENFPGVSGKITLKGGNGTPIKQGAGRRGPSPERGVPGLPQGVHAGHDQVNTSCSTSRRISWRGWTSPPCPNSSLPGSS